MRSILAVIAILFVACGSARGDEIRLKNGAIINGRIVREDPESIVVDLGRGRMNIARRDIASIRRTQPVEPQELPGPRDGGGTNERTRRPATPARQDALPPGGGIPRTPVQPVLRKKRDRTPTAGPKVVPVERTPPPRPRQRSGGEAPESALPARAPNTRGHTASAPASSKPAQKRATADPDW